MERQRWKGFSVILNDSRTIVSNQYLSTFISPYLWSTPSICERLGINLEGYIDLIEKDDTIVEFKTSAQTMNQMNVGSHLQLTIYSDAYEMLYQKPPKFLKIVNFVKSKKLKMILFETVRCKDNHQRFFSLTREVLKGIDSNVFFPKPGFKCKDCEYIKPCIEWKGKIVL